eukprot:gene6606-6675_t
MAWDSRTNRVLTVYVPLACFLLILLFPFYWMTITAFKANTELLDYKNNNPFWITSPTLINIKKLLFETEYPRWLMTTMGVAFGATILSLFSSVLAAYAIQRLRFKGSKWVGLGIYLAYLVPPSILFIPLASVKTVPVAILTELVQGDVYQWGSLMAGALLGSLPVAIFYSFFVEYYVSSLTGAVKE